MIEWGGEIRMKAQEMELGRDSVNLDTEEVTEISFSPSSGHVTVQKSQDVHLWQTFAVYGAIGDVLIVMA